MSKCFMAAISTVLFFSLPVMADNWRREVQVDRITDKQTIWYGTQSVDAFDCTEGASSARLYLTCTLTGFSVLLGTTKCVFSTTEIFSYRVDSQERSYLIATPQESMTAVHLGSASDKDRANLFVEEMLTGKTLLLKVNALTNQSSIAEFDVDGLLALVGGDFDDCLPN